jgi:integrase
LGEYVAVHTGEIVPADRDRSGSVVVPQHVIDNYLSEGARKLIIRGIPDSTLKAYAWQWHLFRLWCEKQGRAHAPTTEATMIEYLHSWESRPVHVRCAKLRCGHRPSPSTSWIWYSAVRFYHGAGRPPLPWEAGKRLELAMKAYGERMVDEGWEPSKAPRAYDSDVTRMVDALDLDNPKHLRDRAIILTNFYTAARASDLASYRLGDVGRTPKGIELTLRRSKTNKSGGRKAEKRRIRPNTVHPVYCGVTALTAWRAWLSGLGIVEGALFRPFNKHDQLVRGNPDAVGYKMESVNITRAVQRAAIRAGIEHGERYTSHSLRRGRATQQRELGVDPIEIARAYGWVPGGAILEYLEEAEGWAPTAPGAVGFL